MLIKERCDFYVHQILLYLKKLKILEWVVVKVIFLDEL